MLTLYHCPDCDRVHNDPFEAAFSLLARCVDCALATERHVAAVARPFEIPRAA